MEVYATADPVRLRAASEAADAYQKQAISETACSAGVPPENQPEIEIGATPEFPEGYADNCLAEKVGFEPTDEETPSPVFETGDNFPQPTQYKPVTESNPAPGASEGALAWSFSLA